MMAAEFKDACRAIDQRADEAERQTLQGAFQSLLAGDTAKRDRLCGRHSDVGDARDKAKIEAWLRIGEKYGLSREVALKALKRISH